ncbi:monovalent cation/H+ antiporter subunit D family protein [Halostella sp. JP-L12]|uniref:proton-conducting transporter transmembrane domain-containing protein n=1 Tax=Halostella TaxID=1843185 RepID=UPI000EF7FDFC|nr:MULTISPECIES: proton-conducting transporter membrane subunit [Halostella]NHN47394.1 monovalent cation/H+ antiporter subunit D family protein [Halostella sp. JP-L12]
MSDVPALLVAVPILAGVVALLVGQWRARAAWAVAALASAVQVGMAGLLAARVLGGETVSYEVGNFPAPYGIELVVDGLSASVVLLVAVVAFGVLLYSRVAGPREPSFHAQYLLLVAGLSGMSVTGDVFNLYVFLEITGLAAYALVASGESGRAAVGALKYLLVGTVGASLYLLGVGYAFIVTGTLNMADMAAKLGAEVAYTHPAVLTAFALIVTGLAVKSAVFPLHTWQPEAYASAPDSVSAFISALVSTVSAYAIARMIVSVFTVEFFRANPVAQDLVVGIAGLSVVAGSVLAVTQTEVKRMLAYSSVSQFGLVVAAFAIATETAVTGGTIHLIGHAVMKGGLFLAVGAVAAATGARYVSEYRGLASRRPFLAGAVAVLALAMVGVPPAVGFVGKWYIALAAVESESWFIAVVILSSTLLTLAYFARLVERMYFASAPTAAAEPAEPTGPVPDAAVADGSGEAAASERPGTPDRVTPGVVTLVIGVAVLAVALGFVATEFAQLLQQTLPELLSP